MNVSDKILALSAELGPKKKDLEAQQKRLQDITTQVAEIDDNEQEELLLAEVEEVGKGVDALTTEVEGLEKKLDSYRAIEKRQAIGARPADTAAPATIKSDRLQSKPGRHHRPFRRRRRAVASAPLPRGPGHRGAVSGRLALQVCYAGARWRVHEDRRSDRHDHRR